jgi:hypothetical protein
MAPLLPVPLVPAVFTFRDWLWSGGLIELSLVMAAFLVAAWFVNRSR